MDGFPVADGSGEATRDTGAWIVGAGPTGLMLANQLARRGVSVLLIEKNTGPARQARELGVQARTLEIPAKLGLAERTMALGNPATGGNVWSNGTKRGRAGFGDAGLPVTPYPSIRLLVHAASSRRPANCSTRTTSTSCGRRCRRTRRVQSRKRSGRLTN